MDWQLWLTPIWQRTVEQDKSLISPVWDYNWTILVGTYVLIYAISAIVCLWDYRANIRKSDSNDLREHKWEWQLANELGTAMWLGAIAALLFTLTLYAVVFVFWVFGWYVAFPFVMIILPLIMAAAIRLTQTNLWVNRVVSSTQRTRDD